MISLLIDGCLDYLEIALIKDNKIIKTYFEKLNKNLTKILVENINGLIKNNNYTITDIQAIYVVNGPGSFSCTKSVVIFANTFKTIFSNIKLYYLNSCLWNITKQKEICLIDAKSNLFYIAYQTFKNAYLIRKDEVEKLVGKDLYFYNLKEKKLIESKWNFNFEKFNLTNYIKPIYIKKPVFDYNKI